jgi:hypothetical protein
MKLKRVDLKTKVKGNLTAIVCKDKRNVSVLKNLHSPPLEGNFCDEHGKAMKSVTIQDYNRHMGCIDKSDCMTNSCTISRQTWKWTMKLLFHLLDLIILNSFIILASCGSKLTHRHFRHIDEVGGVPQPQTAGRRRQAPSVSQQKRFDPRHNRHWLMQCKRIRCRVFCQKQRNKNKIYVSRMQRRVVWYPMLWSISHQTAFLRTRWH